jgi:hypothetical protein
MMFFTALSTLTTFSVMRTKVQHTLRLLELLSMIELLLLSILPQAKRQMQAGQEFQSLLKDVIQLLSLKDTLMDQSLLYSKSKSQRFQRSSLSTLMALVTHLLVVS